MSHVSHVLFTFANCRAWRAFFELETNLFECDDFVGQPGLALENGGVGAFAQFIQFLVRLKLAKSDLALKDTL